MMETGITNLYNLFEKGLCLNPDKNAVEYFSSDHDKTKTLTYKQVHDIAEQIKQEIENNRPTNTKQQQNVCLIYHPMVLHTSVVLGVLHASCYYSYLHPTIPEQEMEKYIKNTAPKFIITDKHFVNKTKKVLNQFGVDFTIKQLPFKPHLLYLIRTRLNTTTANLPIDRFQPLAYCMSTSGTLGKPKLVYVPHVCIVSNILHLMQVFGVLESDKVAAISSLSFDLSVVEMFISLASGATYIVMSNTVLKTPLLSCNVITGNHVTIMQSTPSFIRRMDDTLIRDHLFGADSRVRVLALGGEMCPSHATIKTWIHNKPDINVINLYGITEVSCWATYHHLPMADIIKGGSEPIPLGIPFHHTYLELIDTESGCTLCVIQAMENTMLKVLLTKDVSNNAHIDLKGLLKIGGDVRSCYIKDQPDSNMSGVLGVKTVSTGDVVSIRIEMNQICTQHDCWFNLHHDRVKIHFIGRLDEQVKRNGKRINLSYIQQTLERYTAMRSAHVVDMPSSGGILAFCSTSAASNADSRVDIYRFLHKNIEQQFIPDEIIFVERLPLTKNGKVCRDSLLKLYESNRSDYQVSSCLDIGEVLLTCWCEVLGLSTRCEHENVLDDNLLKLGGDSLSAVRLLTSIERRIPHMRMEETSQLLHIILSRTYKDILDYIKNKTAKNKSKRRIERQLSDNEDLVLVKKTRSSHPPVCEEKYLDNGAEELRALHRGMTVVCDADVSSCQLDINWKYDTGKCVDASPLVVIHKHDRSVVIGSHSHHMARIDMDSGEAIWKVKLGGRIESSACLLITDDIHVVAVGCYDYSIYFINYQDGEIIWKYTTDGEVKSSPCNKPNTSLVYVGSHDGCLYCLDANMKKCKWKSKLSSSYIFSSPTYHDYKNNGGERVFVGSLCGKIFAVQAEDGDSIWIQNVGKPFFSSPQVCSSGVVVGCCDGKIYLFAHSTGTKIWEFGTNGPIFSSPCVYSSPHDDDERILCGSNDGFLYCFNSTDGELSWRESHQSRICSTPFCIKSTVPVPRGVVASASVDGTLMLCDVIDGKLIGKMEVGGEMFSSPVLIPPLLLILHLSPLLLDVEMISFILFAPTSNDSLFFSFLQYCQSKLNRMGQHFASGSKQLKPE